ncbi:hypothetical protein KP509_29G026000 [Ceratopteris richardii]|uniref:Uncharacterized protein n=1 Tax=Ceratopteris richardii TaxID=49495 RepID=A0A8T2R7V5_CERRI|nr:hypothetical protein KP509_29G026000 [Ceratopteris richardii]
MYSEELDYLRSLKSLLFKILPLHPDFLSRRREREALELNSCLLDLRSRLTELESKQQFSYKHHDKDSNSSYASTLKLKGITGDNDVHNLQKRKLTSLSPRDFSFPPSLSSSSTSSLSCKKALPVTVSSDCSKKSPPTPSKRSLSVTCSRSPSSRSNSSSLLENHNSKRYLALRSPLKSVLDDSASFSKEFRSRSCAFTHSSSEDIKVPLQHELRIQSPGSLRYRPKYGDHGELLSTKLEGPSDHTKNKSYLEKYASKVFHQTKLKISYLEVKSDLNLVSGTEWDGAFRHQKAM